MSVYLITDLDIHDSEVFAEYQERFPAIIDRHGGRYLVRGGEVRVMSGEWDLHRVDHLRVSRSRGPTGDVRRS